jgi:hypothetical protein
MTACKSRRAPSVTTTDNLDADAMARAIEICRSESKQMREHYDQRLAEDDWQDVGISAAFHCQATSLALDPWRLPPCFAHVTEPRRDEDATELRQLMIDNGVSIYEPLPLAALDVAAKIRRQQGARKPKSSKRKSSKPESGNKETAPVSDQ